MTAIIVAVNLFLLQLFGAMINDLFLCVDAVCRFSRGLSFAVRTPPASKPNQSDDRAFLLADQSG